MDVAITTTPDGSFVKAGHSFDLLTQEDFLNLAQAIDEKLPEAIQQAVSASLAFKVNPEVTE
jgi:hypothetical protein